MSDEAYHFPPDLLEQLVNTIPLLCRSKQNVLDFFRGCGVAHADPGRPPAACHYRPREHQQVPDRASGAHKAERSW